MNFSEMINFLAQVICVVVLNL